MVAKSAVVYDDFSGGHWGLTKPASVQKNQWFGSNTQLYPGGSLGPRRGAQQISPSGLPTTAAARPAMMFARDGRIFFIVGSTLYFTPTNATTSVTAATGALPGGTSSSAAQLYTDLRLNRYWVNRVGLGFGYMDGGTNTWTTVATPVNFRMIAVKSDRMVGASGRVLYFSAAGDYTSWPALNQIDLGEGSDIQFMHSSGDSLYVATEATLYVIQGVLGASTTVRQVASLGARNLRARGNGTSMNQEPWRAAKLGDDTVAWVNAENGGAGNHSFLEGVVNGYGQGTMEISWLRNGQVRTSVHPNYSLGDLGSSGDSYEVFHAASGDRLFLFPQGHRTAGAPFVAHGVDSQGRMESHTFTTGASFGGFNTPLQFIAGPQLSVDRSSAGTKLIGWVTWDGTNCKFWLWDPEPGRGGPSTEGGLDFDSSVYLAPFYSQDGSFVRPRTIEVYGTVFGTGGATSLTCDSFVLGPEQKSDNNVTNESMLAVDPTSLYASSPTTPDRFVHRQLKGNAPWGRGFYVRLLFKRITIEKVVVSFESRPPHE